MALHSLASSETSPFSCALTLRFFNPKDKEINEFSPYAPLDWTFTLQTTFTLHFFNPADKEIELSP